MKSPRNKLKIELDSYKDIVPFKFYLDIILLKYYR